MFDNIELLFNDIPFDWDKKSYAFNRDEKDMHPYSIVNRKDSMVIVHNVLGINKEDLKISMPVENGKYFITIEGKTKDAIGKVYSVNSRFAIDPTQLDLTKEITARVSNGLLYITIALKKEEEFKIKDKIVIL